ncbi:MAG TPA: ClbS/DfsB family four-helix bundle protein [Anaerolineales bacterium]|nr:ClbS/DfsB family four-helix bundle protein [Anaerolineales bacterium]
MDMKEHILAALREQFDNWEELLVSLSEEQIITPNFDFDWSIKDVMAHLWGWQQISLARLEGGTQDQEPELPKWVEELNGDWEENADQTNAKIYETNHGKSWSEIHQNWKNGFLRLLELGNRISERDLLDTEKYPWLKGYSLAFILVASYDHHQEHLEKLTDWLGKESNRK